MFSFTEQDERGCSVLLVSMPWTTLTEPSLGLGLLKAVLERHNIRSRVLHPNLFLLQHLQARTYERLAVVYSLNDFLFSATLDPSVTNTQHRRLRQKVGGLLSDGAIDVQQFGGSEGVVAALLRLRGEVLPIWLAGWADEIAQHPAMLVGFTCMFDQTVASLALARLVKERAPEKTLVLGGYAVRAPTAQMIVRCSPWIDAVCDGEGEVAIVKLASVALGELPLADVPGIVFRAASGEVVATPPPPPVDLNANPIPNYDDYFADLRRLSERHSVDVLPPDLPIENSRGCWWGAKSHCVFCGIRSDDMGYRARDAGRVLETMTELRNRHGIAFFRFSDYILPHKYFETLLPELARLGRPYRLSAEMKANISEERFTLLARAGFDEVQLGIESFSSDVLGKMQKGVSAIQNVHSLVLGRRFGIRVLYNLLYGFPDDDATEYERMAAMLPRLLHLDPPVTCVPVQITRYAPLQTRPEAFGIERATPEECYDLIFSREYLLRTGFDLKDFCYYFERSFENPARLQRIYDRICAIAKVWGALWKADQAWLYQDGPVDGDGITIRDRRGTEEKVHHLDADEAEVLFACGRPVSMRTLRETQFRAVGPEAVDEVIDALDSLGLIFREDQHLVSLVLPARPGLMRKTWLTAASNEATAAEPADQ